LTPPPVGIAVSTWASLIKYRLDLSATVLVRITDNLGPRFLFAAWSVMFLQLCRLRFAVGSTSSSLVIPTNRDTGILEVVVVDKARLRQLKEQRRLLAPETMLFPSRNGENVSFAQLQEPSLTLDVYASLDNEKRLVFVLVVMRWTALAGENKQVLPAVTRFDFVGYPAFHKAHRFKISLPEI